MMIKRIKEIWHSPRDIHSGNGIPMDRSNVIITEYTSLLRPNTTVSV